jgi:hypothetical protein
VEGDYGIVQVSPRFDGVLSPNRHRREDTPNGAPLFQGAVSLDGRLIDAASIRVAQTLLAKIDQIDARDGSPMAIAQEQARVARAPRS